MNRERLILLAAALSLAAPGAMAGENVIVNYEALDRLPPKSAAAGIAAPHLIPPNLVDRKRPHRTIAADPFANAPAGPEATPPAVFEPHESIYNRPESGADEMPLGSVFTRTVFLGPPSGISAATLKPEPDPVAIASAGADEEPMFVSWNRARTIGEIYFEADGDDMSEIEGSSIAALDELALHIGQNRTRVLLRAFGGAAGDRSHEAHKLALRRGLAVRKYLMARGVPSLFIDVTAMGGVTDGGPPDRVDVLAGAS